MKLKTKNNFSIGTYVRFKNDAYEILVNRLGSLFKDANAFGSLTEDLKKNKYFIVSVPNKDYPTTQNNEDRCWVTYLDNPNGTPKYYFTQAFEEISDLEIIEMKLRNEIGNEG